MPRVGAAATLGHALHRARCLDATARRLQLPPSLLVPGRTVWQSAPADHFAMLVDGAAYFEALAVCMAQARHSIFILGWDIDTRLHLARDMVGFPEEMSAFFDVLVRNRPELRIRILTWDYSPVYLLEREVLPALKFGAKTHHHVRFALDGEHPPFAAHHQKIVVIDDAIAFSGGLDLTDHRWDQPSHIYQDPTRRTLDGEMYTPFHDIQAACDGPAAKILAEQVRERWHRATGERVPLIATGAEVVAWPAALPADLTNVEVGVSRTDPAHRDRPLVREVEELFLASIAAAQELLYIENQYITAPSICDAIAARLAEENPPAIVIVGPVCGDGWVESQTVGAAHAQCMLRLQRADKKRRLRLCYAMVPDGDPGCSKAIFIHSKIMIVDDRLLRVGSANLTNRSLGVDTECDLSVEAHDARTAKDIARTRARLVGEHMGMGVDDVIAATNAHGLLALIDARQLEARTLREIGNAVGADGKRVTEAPEPTVMAFADPAHPITPADVLDTVVPDEAQQRARFPYVRLATIVALLVVIALTWRFTGLAEITRLDTLLSYASDVRNAPAAPLWCLLGFAVLSQLFVPLNLLIITTVLVFGPLLGPVLALAGACTAASLGYAAGSLLGGDLVKRLAGRRVMSLRRSLARAQILPVFVLRIVPIAPAQIISLVAGAWRVRFRSFLLGTALGTLPGLIVLTLLGQRLEALLFHPSWQTGTLLVCFALVLIGLMLFVRSFLRRRGGTPS